jgi:hypothetical protein
MKKPNEILLSTNACFLSRALPLWKARNRLHEREVDQKSLEPVKMTRYALAGVLDSLGDEGHTGYLRARIVAANRG